MRYLTVLTALFVCLVSTASLSRAQVSAPEVQTVVAWGETAATDDQASDKRTALAHARRAAVERVVGSYVTSQTLVKNYQVVEDRIYSQAAGLVNTYRVLREERDALQRVEIEAVVGLIPVTDLLRSSGLLRRWRVGVLLDPDGQSTAHISGYYSSARIQDLVRGIEAHIGGDLVKAGFKVMEPRLVEKLRKEFDKEHNISRGSAQGLDILITGEVSFAARKTMGNVFQATCGIHAEALKVETGEIVYTGTIGNTFDGVTLLVDRSLAMKHASSLGNGLLSDGTPDLRSFGGGVAGALDKAVRLASTLAGEVLVSQISRLPAAVSSKIALEITGLDFSSFMSLEEGLRGLEGVAAVHAEEFTGGVQLMEVEFDGDAMDLARTLSRAPFPSEGKLKIKKVGKSRIIMEVQ